MVALVFEVYHYSTYTYEYKLNNITLIIIKNILFLLKMYLYKTNKYIIF